MLLLMYSTYFSMIFGILYLHGRIVGGHAVGSALWWDEENCTKGVNLLRNRAYHVGV